MKVSVVIPVYNVEEYLKQCVESVLALKTDCEIILVDDGSTDNSGLICDEFAAQHEKISVIHQPNGGLSAARNTGIRNCIGDYVMFVDSDDFLHPSATDALLSAVQAEPDVFMGLYENYYTDQDLYEPE